jgi:TraE protein
MDRRVSRLLRPPLIASALIGVNLVTAVGLTASALRPRPVVILPSAHAEGELLPAAVPEEAAREFALRYVLHFDNFTPSTLEATQRVLQRMIGARSWSGATEALEKRRQVVQEGRMSSQVIPLEVRTKGMTVTVEALRRTFISDRLSREAKVHYEVTLERQPPTDPNPFGLGVVAQVIHEEVPQPSKEKP